MKENSYVDVSFEDLVKKRGNPSYSINHMVDESYRKSDYEPDYTKYFSAAELADTVIVKRVSWKKTHNTLLVWFKSVDEDWISFCSVEYRGPFLK